MTATAIFSAALAVASAPSVTPLVDRFAGAMRGEMTFCDMPAPSLSPPPPCSPYALMESVSLRPKAGENVPCEDIVVSLLTEEGWFPDAMSIPPLRESPVFSVVGNGVGVPALKPDAVPVASRDGPCISSCGVRCLADGAAEGILAGIVFDGLSDGTLPARLPEWRSILLDMLAGRVPTRDFDRAFDLLLGTFPGSDAEGKAAALLKWAARLPIAKDSADVCRALTRHRITVGEYDLAVESADAMTGYHAGYLPNALYLKAHAHAFAGRFDEARQCLAKALELNPVGAAHARILYLQAWMFIQEGDIQAASALLRDIVSRHPSTKYAKQARSILVSLEG